MVKDNYDSGRNRMGSDSNSGNVVQAEYAEGEVPFPCTGNAETMNMNPLLLGNIRTTDYFKNLAEVKTFDQYVDQVYYDAKMCVPWLPGTHNQRRTSGMCSAARGVSDAGTPSETFILLYKLFTLRPSANQINTMINHHDSPYIRAIGFIFLRYTCDLKRIWSWFENYCCDEEELYMKGEKHDTKQSTIGALCRQLLTEIDFHDTMLPRIPVPVMKEIKAKLAELPPIAGADSYDDGYDRDRGGAFKGGKGGGYQGSNHDGRGGGGHRHGYEDRGRDYNDLDAPRDRGGDRDRDRDYRRDDRDRDRDYRRDDRDRDRDYRRDDRDRDRDRDYRRDRDRDYDRDRDRRRH